MTQQGPLMFSENRGRYAICTGDSMAYPDITSGMLVEVKLGGQWVQGRVQFGAVYVGPRHLPGTIGGYYFEARGGDVAGLCAGMMVRIP